MKVVILLALVACLAGCVDSPLPDGPPASKIVATWDPLQCGDPHRVAVELEDTEGAPLSGSTNCGLGSLTLDAPHFGVYRGRIYAWQLGIGERSPADVHLIVDEPIVRWNVTTPR
ncbi:MAG: hypothetical protein ABI591_13670 [Kofleriaceae bacterium]